MAQNRKDNDQDNEFVKDNEPFVMAVDASWGMGKTYFARNWECKLLHDDYKVCYIDAFEYDFTDDPFMTITSNLIEAFEFTELEEVSNKLNTFFRAFKGHLGAAVPALVGGALKLISGIPYVNGIAEIAGGLTSAASKAVKDANNKSMNPADEVLQSDLSYSATMTQFKDTLKELIKQQNSDKPFIVIIDELDRCKPTFAIEFLEKLKHIFDVDNLVFVTFINHNELSNAVKGMYGESFDGKKYLDKFFNLKLTFPKMYGDNLFYAQFIDKHMREKIIADSNKKNMYFNANEAIGALNDVLRFFQELYQLSLRDIENITEILKYMYFKDEHDACNHVILRIIYLYNNDFYNKLKQFNKNLIDIDDKYGTFKKVDSLSSDNDKRIQYGKACDMIMDFMSVYDGVYGTIDEEYSLGNIKFSPLNTPKDYMNNLIRIVESICE